MLTEAELEQKQLELQIMLERKFPTWQPTPHEGYLLYRDNLWLYFSEPVKHRMFWACKSELEGEVIVAWWLGEIDDLS